MSMLHTVNKSPFEKRSLESCLSCARDGSAILLIEDGVYAAARGNRFEALLRDASRRMKVYALGPDLDARGLGADAVADGIEIVDYDGFVDLTVAHDQVQSWL